MKKSLIIFLFLILITSHNVFSQQSHWSSATGGLRLREKPSLNAKAKTIIPYNSKVRVLKKETKTTDIDNKKGHWTYIQWGNIKGWVFDAYLTQSMYDDKISYDYLLNLIITQFDLELGYSNFYDVSKQNRYKIKSIEKIAYEYNVNRKQINKVKIFTKQYNKQQVVTNAVYYKIPQNITYNYNKYGYLDSLTINNSQKYTIYYDKKHNIKKIDKTNNNSHTTFLYSYLKNNTIFKSYSIQKNNITFALQCENNENLLFINKYNNFIMLISGAIEKKFFYNNKNMIHKIQTADVASGEGSYTKYFTYNENSVTKIIDEIDDKNSYIWTLHYKNNLLLKEEGVVYSFIRNKQPSSKIVKYITYTYKYTFY